MDTPVIFLVFNRPQSTERVFAEIARARPARLLVVADGPRPERIGEAEKCNEVRRIIDRVDWNCEVLKNYSDVNMGCGDRVSSGLIWAFEHVDEAVILEDDTLPHPTFFRFCGELLERYRHDERIMHISGNNFQLDGKPDPYSYHFSRYDHIWGWATWRRAFGHYDYRIHLWERLRGTSWLMDTLGDPVAAEWWSKYFDLLSKADRKVYDSWDCQWVFALWAQSGLSITPAVNLITNIGFGEEASHTTGADHPLGALPVTGMTFPLKHPPYMIRHREADDFAFEQACEPKERAEGKKTTRNHLAAFIRRYRAVRRVSGEILTAASRVPRAVKILLLKRFHRSDYGRWADPSSLETWWRGRTEQMAQLIPKNTRVIEFGAGQRCLETVLDSSCTYVPSDLVDRGPGTVICDLNERPLPDLRHIGADVAFFAGVLEYVRDLGSAIDWLSKQVSFCIASYAYVPPKRGIMAKYRERLSRLYYGYMNDYTEEELVELFKKYGFAPTAADTWTSQRIYLFRNLCRTEDAKG